MFRYTRLFINLAAVTLIKPIPLPAHPTVLPSDVTTILATTGSDIPALIRTAASILLNGPAKLVIVTSTKRMQAIADIFSPMGMTSIKVIGVRRLDKRQQMLRGLLEVDTDIVAFADDDVLWPPTFLRYLLAAFEDPLVSATGPRQRVLRSKTPNVWHFLGTAYLERRNFNTMATNYLDGSVSTLSGRTSLYRTTILDNEDFFKMFDADCWFGKRLNSDDDKCLTRWVFSKGWKIHLQMAQESTLVTTLEEGSNFLSQCIRWARAHWRGNLKVMISTDYWYR